MLKYILNEGRVPDPSCVDPLVLAYTVCCLCMSLCSHCVPHCAHTVYVIVLTLCAVRHCAHTVYVTVLTHRPSDPATIGELVMPQHHVKETNITGGSISKLKAPEKRKMSKRPYSYLAAMDSPNGMCTVCIIIIVQHCS